MALAGIVVGLVAVIAVVAGIFLMMPSGSEKVAVPNFVGLDIDEVLAEQDGKYADFYLAEADKREYDPKYKEGQIISQDPEEGEKVTKGTKIVLTVCGTEEDQEEEEGYELIDFSDMELSEVERLLKQNGLEDAYKIEKEPSDEIEEGRVIRSDPGKGTKVTKDDTITIYVSSGKETETVKVPDVTGMTLDKAKDMLKSYGLTVGETHNEESDRPVGEVFRQSIEEGTKVAEGTAVNLYISKGKTEETTEPDNGNEGGNSGTTQEPSEPSGSQTVQPKFR